MARQVRRISELPEATELTGDELLEIVQDGGNKRVTVDQLSGGSAPVQSVQGRTGDVVITAEDVGLGNVDNTSDADKPVSAAQQAALDGKVDKAAGMGLSSNDFTDPLRDKLIGLEGTHWRGTFVSLAALQAGVTDPAAGDYADVDVVGDDVVRYIWDATDSVWVVQSGAVAPITASQVKQLYESNPDTNAFTDAEKSKLGDVQPWATAPTQDAAQTALGMSTSGKAVATGTAAQGRSALGLGSAAIRDVATSRTDSTLGRLLRVGDFGLGSAIGGPTITSGSADSLTATGFYRTSGAITDVPASDGLLKVYSTSASSMVQEFVSILNPRSSYYRVLTGGEWTPWRELHHTGNTTVDSNGFIKNASPIIKLHSDRAEAEAPATFERLGTGHYRITGCNGLRLTDGWYIETPHDRNKVPYFNVEWEQDHEPDAEAGVLDDPADVTLTIRCYERVWSATTGQFDNGDPVDIPEGRWIDLRMNEVRQPEIEMDIPEEGADQPAPPSEPDEPVIPSVVTMAQAKLALLYAGLFEAAEQYINDLPEPLKSAALIEWNHRQTLEREHPLVGQVADGLGLTEQQLDDLFLDASTR